MKTTVLLENKDVRVMIASFLGLKVEDIIPNRYNFSVQNMSAEEIEGRIQEAEGKLEGDK